MKVIDVLKLCSCRVDIYYKGQYVTECRCWKDMNNIEDWLLNSNVVDLDVYHDFYSGDHDDSIEVYLE